MKKGSNLVFGISVFLFIILLIDVSVAQIEVSCPFPKNEELDTINPEYSQYCFALENIKKVSSDISVCISQYDIIKSYENSEEERKSYITEFYKQEVDGMIKQNFSPGGNGWEAQTPKKVTIGDEGYLFSSSRRFNVGSTALKSDTDNWEEGEYSKHSMRIYYLFGECIVKVQGSTGVACDSDSSENMMIDEFNKNHYLQHYTDISGEVKYKIVNLHSASEHTIPTQLEEFILDFGKKLNIQLEDYCGGKASQAPSETEAETPSENLQTTQEETSTSISTHEKLVDKLLKALENDDKLKLFLLTLSNEETSELFTKNIQEEVGNEVWGKINRASRETDSYKSKVITILTKSLQEDDPAFVLLKHQDTKEWQQIIVNQVIQERIEKKKELKKEAEFEESMDSIRVRNARYEWMAEQREERDRLMSMSLYERFGESIQDLIPFQRLLNAKNFETLTDPNSYLYERLDAALGPLGFMLPVIGDVADFTTTMDMYKAVLDGKTDIGLGTFTLQYIGTFLPLYSFGGMKNYVNYAEDTLMYTGLGKSAIENIQPSRPPSSG